MRMLEKMKQRPWVKNGKSTLGELTPYERAADRVNTLCNNLDSVANDLFNVAQMPGCTTQFAGQLLAYANVISSIRDSIEDEGW